MVNRKLRVGVWVPEGFVPADGGGYSYLKRLLDRLSHYQFHDAEIKFISFNIEPENFQNTICHKIHNRIEFNIAERVFNKMRIDPFGRIKQKKKRQKKELSSIIDVIYYPLPTNGVKELIHNFPFICTLWDMSYLSTYPFPEFSMNGEYEHRSYHFEEVLSKALMIFAESNAGKEAAEKILKIDSSKISVVPLSAADFVSSQCGCQRPQLLNESDFFIHYPAQFWPHKNHYNLILAFVFIRKHFPSIKLVLSGSDKGNKPYILQLISELGLQNSIVDLGFVSKEELKWVYLNSKGLVMPTFLGPTNMPLLEAAGLNCPVACSDFAGHREQLGDYAYYFNQASFESISETVIKMLQNDNSRRREFSNKTFTIENAMNELNKNFSAIKNVRFCWGDFDEIF